MTRNVPINKDPVEKLNENSNEDDESVHPKDKIGVHGAQDETPAVTGTEDNTPHIVAGTSTGVNPDDEVPPPEKGTTIQVNQPLENSTGENRSENISEERRKSTRKKSAKGSVATDVYSSMDTTADEVEYDERRKTTRRKSNVPKNPPLHSQMSVLMEKSDRQAARIDELFKIMRQPPPRSSPEKHGNERGGHNRSPPRERHGKRHVSGSMYKRRSPKHGHSTSRRASRAPSRYHDVASDYSSTSTNSDTDSQVRRAIDMLEPRFSRRKGKRSSHDDKVSCYRPFAYLEREQQRSILKSGHPEELTVTQHLSGLCGMALEKCDTKSDVHAIVTHIAQILEDQSYMQWASVRAFSNTVIAQIARGRWGWADDRMLERCRTNMYMRCRYSEESTWTVPCPKFNQGRCNWSETHNVGEVMMRHICAGCVVNGYENNHTLRACKWRKGQNNNQRKESSEDRRDQRYKAGGRQQESAREPSKN